MFLDSKMKQIVKVFWWVMSAIIIVSMVLLYTPLPFLSQNSQPQYIEEVQTAPEPQPDPLDVNPEQEDELTLDISA